MNSHCRVVRWIAGSRTTIRFRTMVSVSVKSFGLPYTRLITYSIRSPIKLTTVVYLLKMYLGRSYVVNL